jgi:hypothetical protein
VPSVELVYVISEITRQKVVDAQWMYGSKGRHGLDVLAPWPDKVSSRIRSGFFKENAMARQRSQFKLYGFPSGSKKGNAGRKEVLNLNKELRNLTNPLGHQPWGSTILQIPELDFYVLVKRYPDLMSADAEISTRAYDKFLRSPESEPYRVRTTDKVQR